MSQSVEKDAKVTLAQDVEDLDGRVIVAGTELRVLYVNPAWGRGTEEVNVQVMPYTDEYHTVTYRALRNAL